MLPHAAVRGLAGEQTGDHPGQALPRRGGQSPHPALRGQHPEPPARHLLRRASGQRHRRGVRARRAVDVQRVRRRHGEDMGPTRGRVPARVRESRRGDGEPISISISYFYFISYGQFD